MSTSHSAAPSIEAGENILEATHRFKDLPLKSLVLIALESGGPNCIAGEVKYHFTCYRHFVSDTRTKSCEPQPLSYHLTIQELASEISEQLNDDRKVAALSTRDLRHRYVHALSVRGTVYPQYRTSHLKECTQAHFLRPITSGEDHLARVIEGTLHTTQESLGLDGDENMEGADAVFLHPSAAPQTAQSSESLHMPLGLHQVI